MTIDLPHPDSHLSTTSNDSPHPSQHTGINPTTNNLWNDILTSAKRHGERLPSKHVLVLGEKGTGKSTLVHQLFKDQTSSLDAFNPSSNGNPSSSTANHKLYTSVHRHHPPSGPRSNLNLNINSGTLRSKKETEPRARRPRLPNHNDDEDDETQTQTQGLQALSEQVLLDHRLWKTEGMVVDYEWVEVGGREGDDDPIPPISFYTVPSSDKKLLGSLSAALPVGSLSHTKALIVLDWTRPYTIADELIKWLTWIDSWATSTASREEEIQGHDKLQSHLQHYHEPVNAAVDGGMMGGVGGSARGGSVGPGSGQVYLDRAETVLPLAQGVLTHNKCGIPITIVLTKTDRLDSVGDQLVSRGLVKGKGLTSAPGKGGSQNAYSAWNWDERVDWGLAVVRVVALMYGASVFYTTTARPQTFSTLRQHILHRLYASPPALHPQPTSPTNPMMNTKSSSSRFPFLYRANQLDRDSIMIPSGWDSWGKIQILKDGFDCQRVNEMWEVALAREAKRIGPTSGKGGEDGLVEDDDEEVVQQVWQDVMPDAGVETLTNGSKTQKVKSANEQDFLTRQLESLLKDPHRDPRRALRQAALAPQTPTTARNPSFLGESLGLGRATPGIVGPMSSDGLNMPNVEMAFAAMEGKGGYEDIMQTPSMPRRESRPLVPTATPKPVATEISANTASNEVLNNFFQGLIAGRRTPGSTPGKSPGDAAGQS